MNIGFTLIFNSLLLGVGLAMDAFSVSLANGLNETCMRRRKMCGVAGLFAVFQGMMPLLGGAALMALRSTSSPCLACASTIFPSLTR